MNQFNSHSSNPLNPPPTLSILRRLMDVYKLWHEFEKKFPKTSRYTLGQKIDFLFLEIIELVFLASYKNKESKIPYINKAIPRLDTLKFFLQISWEFNILDNKKYITISDLLNEIGRMLGGWLRKLETPAIK